MLLTSLSSLKEDCTVKEGEEEQRNWESRTWTRKKNVNGRGGFNIREEQRRGFGEVREETLEQPAYDVAVKGQLSPCSHIINQTK